MKSRSHCRALAIKLNEICLTNICLIISVSFYWDWIPSLFSYNHIIFALGLQRATCLISFLSFLQCWSRMHETILVHYVRELITIWCHSYTAMINISLYQSLSLSPSLAFISSIVNFRLITWNTKTSIFHFIWCSSWIKIILLRSLYNYCSELLLLIFSV